MDHYRFLSDVLPVLAAQGEAFIGLFEVDGHVVAAQSSFAIGDLLTFYYSGFYTVWNPYSPVFLLGAQVIRHAMTRSIRRVNFLPRDEPWKKRWGAVPRDETYRVSATRLSPLSLTYKTVAHLRGEQ